MKHVPVLLAEVLDAFRDRPKGVIVDGTLGGAGHTVALLDQAPTRRVLGCDQDPAAVSSARERLAAPVADARLAFFEGNFAKLVTPEASFIDGFGPPWTGVLLDLGYSSIQLESADYGMSFQVEGELDMRLSRQGDSAWDLLNESTDQELGDILKIYGEMTGAHRLAQRIKEAVAQGVITNSTLSLASFVEKTLGRRPGDKIHPATLVFQALRIATNDELRVLDHFLEGVILKVEKGGRVAVITFHSLEDRLVKRWGQKYAAQVRQLTKKPIVASQEEVNANARARSAKLRVYEKL